MPKFPIIGLTPSDVHERSANISPLWLTEASCEARSPPMFEFATCLNSDEERGWSGAGWDHSHRSGMELREKDSYPDENSVALDGCRAMQGKETTMRKALILTVGLAVVLLWATSGAAHGRVFFGFGVGAPVPPFI